MLWEHLNGIIMSKDRYTTHEAKTNYLVEKALRGQLSLTFTARLISTPGSVSLAPSYNRTLNFVPSIASKRYRMWVSRRESRHGTMIWKFWLAAVDGFKRREEASKAREFNSKALPTMHNCTNG